MSIYKILLASTALSSTLLGLGCGGDDEACTGHGCPNAPIGLPEGGEVRLELVQIRDDAPEVRTHAWFASGQDPDSRPWPRPPANWEIQDGDDLCVDMRSQTIWPSGLVENRDYYDGGENVKFVPQGGGTEIVLDRRENTQDDAFDNYHDIVYISDISPSDVQPGVYDFVIAGGDIGPATYEGQVVMPGDLQMTFPDMQDIIYMYQDEDFRFTWDGTSDDPFAFAFVAFSDRYGPIGYCIGPNSGYMTIPKDFITSIPNGGAVTFGAINHTAAELEGTGRRIDFVGINCLQSDYAQGAGL